METTPVLASPGGADPDWTALKKQYPDMWTDAKLRKAGEEFALLVKAQRAFYASPKPKRMGRARRSLRQEFEWAEKALNYSILSGWAYMSGLLEDNPTRLKRHFELRATPRPDPLNAKALANARHRSDPTNYRGLGTRNDTKERGRCVELFWLQAERGGGITDPLVDAALASYFKKQATLEEHKSMAKLPPAS